MKQPTFHFRTIRKGLSWSVAQAECSALKAKRPGSDYRVVKLDGAESAYGAYRVLLLRDASTDPMYEQEP